MKKVFICSALRGDVQNNIRKAQDYCRHAMLNDEVLPIAPHAYFTGFLDEDSPEERELGIRAGLELLRDCDELWAFGSAITEGMHREICLAKSLGIPVSYFNETKIDDDRRKTHEISY